MHDFEMILYEVAPTLSGLLLRLRFGLGFALQVRVRRENPLRDRLSLFDRGLDFLFRVPTGFANGRFEEYVGVAVLLLRIPHLGRGRVLLERVASFDLVKADFRLCLRRCGRRCCRRRCFLSPKKPQLRLFEQPREYPLNRSHCFPR